PRPAAPRQPAEPPATMVEDDNEDATRVLSTADLDNFNAAAAGKPVPVRAPAIPIELHVVSGPDRGKVHNLSEGSALVGRGLDCDIVLADPAVSRKHFRVVRTGDDVDAVDMGGANGTNVNGDRISRHNLTPGDQIEVGTTVLEFRIEGKVPNRSRNDFPQNDGTLHGHAAAAPAKAKSKLPLLIGLAAAGFIVLGGGGVAAWFVMSGGDDTEKVSGEGEDTPGIADLIKEAKGQIDDQEWAEAVDTLKKAKKASPSNSDVKGMLAKAEEELEASESIEEGKAQLKKKKFKAAIEHFEEVSNGSEQFSDAQDAIKEAKVDMATAYVGAARKALEAGKNKKAKALLTKVMKVDPKHAEAKLLLEQLAGGEAEGGDKAPAAGGKKDPAVKSGQSAKKLLARGLKAYHNREWSAAKSAFTAVAKGSFSKAERAKGGKYLAGSADVAAAFGTANTQANPLRQAKAWRKAYAADKRVDGHFGAMLIKRLTKAYVIAGKQLYKGGHYAKAAEAVREAMNYDPENAQAMKLEDQCVSQAAKLLSKAKAHMAKKNYATAQGLAREVMGVLPSMDPRAAEARNIAKKAAAADVAGDDD
ncbi:MAG: FHA domain-containing protein, partial [Myxococcales bacterium]|nr:FHA domain-containing protein [Myxococcales bacterium]